MRIQTADGDVQVAAVGHPADNATSTVLTGAYAKSIDMSLFEELVVRGFLKDPETGAKAFNLQLYGHPGSAKSPAARGKK